MIDEAIEEDEEVSSNPFEVDAMKIADAYKDVEVTNQTDKVVMHNSDPKVKTKKK